MFKPIRELTFHDRLSHLTHTQACRLIGPGGKALIANGSRFEKPDPETGFKLSERKLVIRLPKATVTLSHQPDARGHIAWKCSACNTACDHVGVAFSFILEDKASLGLSIAPDERLPIELLERIVRDDKGRLSFSFILPNESTLDLMANAMAQMTPV